MYGFPGCGVAFTEDAVKVGNSSLCLSISKTGPSAYSGGQVISKNDFSYGLFTARIKPKLAPGTVGSLFLMNKWTAEQWVHQEIDIEFLGSKPEKVLLSTHYYVNGVPISHSFEYALGFNASDSFNEYGILWERDLVTWYVNGRVAHSEKRDLPRVGTMNILMNHWFGDQNNVGFVNWLGPLEEDKFPSSIQYDWIRFSKIDRDRSS